MEQKTIHTWANLKTCSGFLIVSLFLCFSPLSLIKMIINYLHNCFQFLNCCTLSLVDFSAATKTFSRSSNRKGTYIGKGPVTPDRRQRLLPTSFEPSSPVTFQWPRLLTKAGVTKSRNTTRKKIQRFTNTITRILWKLLAKNETE